MAGRRARPLRIAYYAHVNGASTSGVFLKIFGQVERWAAQGHDVRLFVATRDDGAQWLSRIQDASVHRYDGLRSRWRAMVEIAKDVRAYAPDLIYVRWDLFYPPMLRFPRQALLVVEVNSDDLREYRLGRQLRAGYNALTRGLVLRRARALVFVTDELARSSSFRTYPGQRRVISNGIDLAAYPSHGAPANERPRLAFVGTAGQSWHGVDKVIRLARLRPGWAFDIVGMQPSSAEAASNVTWHGPLERAGVLDVLGRADIGIGTLALHRKAMNIACPLKVREYLAVGLPVLYGYQDPDIDDVDVLGRFVLRIPNRETNVEDCLADIDVFVARVRGRRVPRSSVSHIDLARKEAERLALFADLAEG